MAASARAKRGAVGAQRARVQTETRAERRRDIVQRSAAIAAAVRTADVDAQPMSAGLAFRIDALHGPSGQILHVSPSRQSGQVSPCGRKSWRDCASEGLVCQGEI